MLWWIGVWWGAWGVGLAQTASEEVVVMAEKRLAEAEDALHQALRDQGYGRVLRIGQRSWYLHPKLWKAGVMVHEQGFVRVRGRPVLPIFYGPIPGHPDLHGLTSVVQTKGTRNVQKSDMVQAIEPHLHAIRDARWAIARRDREVALRKELIAIWFEGIAPDGTSLPTMRERRRALHARWRATADGLPGDGARAAIIAFIDDEVQPSDHPYQQTELAALGPMPVMAASGR